MNRQQPITAHLHNNVRLIWLGRRGGEPYKRSRTSLQLRKSTLSFKGGGAIKVTQRSNVFGLGGNPHNCSFVISHMLIGGVHGGHLLKAFQRLYSQEGDSFYLDFSYATFTSCIYSITYIMEKLDGKYAGVKGGAHVYVWDNNGALWNLTWWL